MQYKRFKLSGLGWLNNLKAEKRGRSHKQKLHEKFCQMNRSTRSKGVENIGKKNS
jgi:hypothetical protein